MEVHSEIKKIMNSHRENKLAHAFLVETNDIERCVNELVELVKVIACEDKNEEHDESDCGICRLIDTKNLANFIIVEPDGSTIKKTQILSLKERFQAKPIIIDYNIYVVKNSEKLNLSSANTMLKFLEEPDGQVVGFFVTNNKKSMINTIVSRCHYIKVNYRDQTLSSLVELEPDIFEEYMLCAKEILNLIENQHQNLGYIIKRCAKNIFDDRKSIEKFFLIILNIYENVYKVHFGLSSAIMDVGEFEFLLNLGPKQLKMRLDLIKKIIIDLRYNINIDLLLDKYLIEMGRMN